MDGQDPAVREPGKYDVLPFVKNIPGALGVHRCPDVVAEDRGRAGKLDGLCAAFAVHHPPTRVLPATPEGPVLLKRLQTGRLGMEKEGGIVGEAVKVRRGIPCTERLD